MGDLLQKERIVKSFVKNLPPFVPIGHRGAPREAPQNTLASFQALIKLAPEAMIELDLWPSADGTPVVFHDPQLQETTNGQGEILRFSVKELKKIDSGYNIQDQEGNFPFRGKGYTIATFTEVLQAFPHTRISVDIKADSPSFAQEVIRLIRLNNCQENTVIGSFYPDINDLLLREAPEIALSFGKKEILRFLKYHKTGMGALYKPRADVMMIPQFSHTESPEELYPKTRQGFRLVTKGLIREAQKKGLPVFVWTINNPTNMERLIKLGVRGIVTDDIRSLMEVLNQGEPS